MSMQKGVRVCVEGTNSEKVGQEDGKRGLKRKPKEWRRKASPRTRSAKQRRIYMSGWSLTHVNVWSLKGVPMEQPLAREEDKHFQNTRSPTTI